MTHVIPDVLLIATLAWGAFAFGAVYPWAFWPLAAAASSVGIAGLAIGPRSHGSIRGLGLTALTIAFCAFLLAGIVQLVPAPLPFLASVSPESARVIPQMDLAVAAGSVSRHPFSIAPARTQLAVVLFAANALLVLGCARLFSIRGARRVAGAIVVVGVALALAGIIQKPLFTGKIYGFWTPLQGGSPFGPFVNRNHFAGWMLMALPLTFGLLGGAVARAMRGVKPDWRDRLVWFSSREASRLLLVAAGAGVMALSLVMTMSRSGITALALAIAIMGAFVMRRQRTTRRAVAIGYLVLLVIVVVGWAGVDAIASQFARADWNELNGRRGPWADAIDVASRFPLSGTGLNTYGTAMLFYQQHELAKFFSSAHNDYLQLAAEGGVLLTIPAALCAAAFIFAVRRRFIEDASVRTYWLRAGAVTGLTAIALQETVEFSLQMPGNAALFAVVCAIALHKGPERRTAHER
jgi:putative inorganic carbon (HCO3(-)) transporter